MVAFWYRHAVPDNLLQYWRVSVIKSGGHLRKIIDIKRFGAGSVVRHDPTKIDGGERFVLWFLMAMESVVVNLRGNRVLGG